MANRRTNRQLKLWRAIERVLRKHKEIAGADMIRLATTKGLNVDLSKSLVEMALTEVTN